MSDEASLAVCYDQSLRDVYRAASRLIGGDRARTDDLVQEVYLSLVRSARSGAVAEVGIGWLLTSMRHRYLDHVRGVQREGRRLQRVWSHPAPEEGGDRADLSGLPKRERVALVLRYVDDLPVAEVAALLGLSVHATESLLARARRRMRSQEVRDA